MKVILTELPEFARQVRAQIMRLPHKGSATLVYLVGELGAGKTTFTQNLSRELGVTDDVQSPTYVLMKSYELPHGRFTKLVHIDAYRLNSAAEFAALKPEDFLADPAHLVLVEWPGKVEGALPKPDLTLTFSSENAEEKERYIDVV